MTRRNLKSAYIAVVSISLLLTWHPARSFAKTYFQSTWSIEPQKVDDTSKLYRPGDIISEARLLPMHAIMLEDQISSGSKVVAAGTEMFGLESDVRAACLYAFDDPTKLQRALVGRKQKYRCFLDEDGDGRFEAEFALSSVYVGVPLAYGKVPSNRTPIAPARYSYTKPTANEDYPRLLIKYDHRDQITGRAYIGLCITSRYNRQEPCFDPFKGIRGEDAQSVEFAGALVEVVGGKSATIAARVVKPFNSSSFSVTETFEIVFY